MSEIVYILSHFHRTVKNKKVPEPHHHAAPVRLYIETVTGISLSVLEHTEKIVIIIHFVGR